jgi:hypothetical protein
MADRYQDRPFPDDDDDRGGRQSSSRNPSKSEADPLAELARLIGQTDPFANLGGRANQPAPPREASRDRYPEPEPEPALESDDAPAGPPPWMQRAAAQIPSRGDDSWQDQDEDVPQGRPTGLHPVQRYAASEAVNQAAAEPDYHQAPPFALHPDPAQHDDADPERYDDALYGQMPAALAAAPPETSYDEPYSYQDDYADAADEPVAKPRRGGMIMVAAVLALAVVGTGGAFAYRTYVAAPRSGEPPIVKADTGPTKIIPPTQTADASGKLIQDRMGGSGTGTEKLVSREETPVDVKDPKAGPRVVFPPLNQNANPPSATSVAPGTRPPATAGNGTLGEEPKKIRTFAVRGDQADTAPVTPPVAKPAPLVRAAAPAAPPAPRTAPPSTPTQAGNAPLSLSPQAQAPQATAPPPAETRRMAANASAAPQQIAPQQIAPAPLAAPAPTGGGGYLVQVSSQRNEADAQASFRSLQGKYPSVLGSRTALIKRAELGEKGTYYRAMVGPFASTDEASQFCGTLKSAGGNCVIQRN